MEYEWIIDKEEINILGSIINEVSTSIAYISG